MRCGIFGDGRGRCQKEAGKCSHRKEGHPEQRSQEGSKNETLRRKRSPTQANRSTQKTLKRVLNVIISGPSMMGNHPEHGGLDKSQIKGSC